MEFLLEGEGCGSFVGLLLVCLVEMYNMYNV